MITLMLRFLMGCVGFALGFFFGGLIGLIGGAGSAIGLGLLVGLVGGAFGFFHPWE